MNRIFKSHKTNFTVFVRALVARACVRVCPTVTISTGKSLMDPVCDPSC